MKTPRFSLSLVLLILASLVLSGCTGAMVNSWPGITTQQDTIYLAHQGSIYTINAGNGQLLCKFPERADPGKPFYGAPAVGDDIIVAGNYGHTLYGLGTTCANEKKVLDQKWTFVTTNSDPDKKAGNFSGSPQIVGDTVLAASTNNRIYALSLADGKYKWFFETGNALWATPVSDGTTVYQAALDHKLYALNLSDGKPVWQKDLGSALPSAPLLTEVGTLYVGTLDGQVAALDAKNSGSILWQTDTSGQIWATPVLKEEMLYVGNASGKVTAIMVKDGTIAWQKDAGSPIIGGGVMMGSTIAFPTEGGNLVGWSLDGKEQTLNQTIGGKLYSTPTLVGDKAVVALTEGGEKLLQALTLDGGLNWNFVQPK